MLGPDLCELPLLAGVRFPLLAFGPRTDPPRFVVEHNVFAGGGYVVENRRHGICQLPSGVSVLSGLRSHAKTDAMQPSITL